ncbi:hypothetical protein ACFFYR_31455 [Paraburkholderia dipogonis]|uniref:hypothetical protein n=1 Tax=Paraburkholderia dipogonis TaxID=1211383 RepID=UPI00141B9FDD|nr:hypothetical protein [Paraburkholderia dipogonis]
MKETRPKPNQLIVISKEASVWSLRLETALLHATGLEPHSGGMSSGTTNMPAVYSI